MENNQINLNLTESVSVVLKADTPDMQTLIDKIVENRSSINVDNIRVTIPDGSNFDKEGFELMMKEVVKEYLKTLELENINFKNNEAQ